MGLIVLVGLFFDDRGEAMFQNGSPSLTVNLDITFEESASATDTTLLRNLKKPSCLFDVTCP